MSQYIGQVHDLIIQAVLNIRANSYKQFLALPLGWRRFVLDVYPHADIGAMTVLLSYVISRPFFTNTPKTIQWYRISMAAFFFGIVLIAMFHQFTMMTVAESASHTAAIVAQGFDAAEVESVSPFQITPPMDLVFGWKQSNVTDLLESLKPQTTKSIDGAAINGIKAYQAYLWLDTFVAIPLYVYIHKCILGALYTDEDSNFFVIRAPFVLGSMDFFENIGHLISTYTLKAFSEEYAAKLQSANNAKFLLFMAIIGLEVSGLFQKVGSTVTEEIKTSGLSVTVPETQKLAEEKRKARLEKKKKN